jgi:putative tryptophan/tyrosine transport system substrate-binding protein
MISKDSFFVAMLVVVIAICLPYSVEGKPWKIALLRTEAPYAIEEENALRKIFKEMGSIKGRNIVILPTKVVGAKTEDFGETAIYVKNLITQKPDLIATIGTQASVPVWPIVEKSGIPMVFAGVTYPVEGNLIESFGKATGKNITGIGYAIPAKERLEVIRKIFPDTRRFKKIACIYSGQIPQDFSYMKDLKSLGNIAGWEFVFVDYFDAAQNGPSLKLLIKKLQETNPDLAFGWYSLDQLGGDMISFKKLSEDFKKPIIATTAKPLEYGGIGGVFTDHVDLSREQAKMIQNILQGEFAGKIAPLQPKKYKIELNLKKAEELGIKFPPDVLKAASRLIK